MKFLMLTPKTTWGGVGKHLSTELILAPTPLFVTLSCCAPRLILN